MRLVEDSVKVNGNLSVSGVIPTAAAPAAILNGGTAHPIKLVATNTGTFVDGIIPVSTNGPIEIAPK